MNAAHLHLVLNHAPVIGLIFTAALLAWALLRRSDEVRRLALLAILAVALVTVLVYVSGSQGEDVVENLPSVTEQQIDRHEDAAKVSLALTEALGVLAAGALAVPRIAAASATVPAAMALNLVAIIAIGWTANLGGQIHHPEARPGFTTPAQHARR